MSRNHKARLISRQIDPTTDCGRPSKRKAALLHQRSRDFDVEYERGGSRFLPASQRRYFDLPPSRQELANLLANDPGVYSDSLNSNAYFHVDDPNPGRFSPWLDNPRPP